MPRRIASDTDFSPPAKPRKKPKAASKPKPASKPKSSKDKDREPPESVISAWARRRTVVDEEDVEEAVEEDIDYTTEHGRFKTGRGVGGLDGRAAVNGVKERTSLFDGKIFGCFI